MSRSADLFKLLEHCIPNDHSRQVSAPYFVQLVLGRDARGTRVLDLGCGAGRSLDMFKRHDPEVKWVGVDIEESPEVKTRTRTDAEFVSYDGINLPFDDGSFDLVFSNQVFEHVRYPEPLLAEVKRVLTPGGAFVGSVSYLEPYHSFSVWNFTPYGWHEVCVAAGLEVKQLRPGIDGVALIRRAFLGRPKEAASWFTSSPMNEEIDAWGKETKRRPALVNLRKLQHCGHIVFYAIRPQA